jgi:uncharacterized protein (TIGR02757 family)
VAGLSQKGAAALKPLLDGFILTAPYAERVRFDPVELPHRYADPRDIEVAGLLSACLAYGRADLFKPKLRELLGQMGASPAAYVAALDLSGAKALLRDFVYRFNVGTDLAVLLLGMGRALQDHGSLEAAFLRGWEPEASMHRALAAFTGALRNVPMGPLRRVLGRERGLHHLLPSPLGPGAAKRLNLFLRWMVRGPDEVDFGVWRSVPASALIIPLDTHVGRIARYLGLTRRKDLSWRTAEEITASLRWLDPADPIKYDFALCHYGMSGVCPARPVAENCASCALLTRCSVGPRVIRPRRT